MLQGFPQCLQSTAASVQQSVNIGVISWLQRADVLTVKMGVLEEVMSCSGKCLKGRAGAAQWWSTYFLHADGVRVSLSLRGSQMEDDVEDFE